MAKKKVEKPKGKFTRRQLSQWQRQKRRQRIILSIGISVIAVVVGLVTAGIYYGWYLAEYKPLKQTVIEVNDTKFNMDYFIQALKFQAGGQPGQYMLFLIDSVVEKIQQRELIRQGALELGITISDKEVNDELKNHDLPHNQAVSDIVRVELLLDKLREEYFEPQVPLSTEQRHIMAMFLESEAQVAEAKDRLEAGEEFSEIAGELSLDSLTKENNGDLGWRPQGVLGKLLVTSLLDDYAFSSEVGVISQPLYDEEKAKSLGYWLIRVLERKEGSDEAHVQAMLLASEEEAQSIKARLDDGEDFDQLASSHSQLPGSSEDKGDLGWLTPGSMSQAVSDFVFASETELNMVSGIISDEEATTTGGYWLFEVLGSDTRELADEDRNSLVDQARDDWLASLMDDPENKVISYLDDEMRAFAVSKAQAG